MMDISPTAKPPAAVLDRAVTAAIRAGYAWSVRRERSEAWMEIARMTGVIMRAHGPGRGPVTPAELVTALRRPLRAWLPTAQGVSGPLGDLVILDEDDRLTDATYEIGCDHTVELLVGQEDPGARWLPGWRVHRAEQIEKAAFQTLLSGDDDAYTKARRFVVEHPAGDAKELMHARHDRAVPALPPYAEIPMDRQCDGLWWPCPVCRWPMHVRATQVRCDFPRHDAVYGLSTDGRKPALHALGGRRRVPKPKPVDGAVCVDESVWRYIVVPGVVEVRLHDRIATIPGVQARLYPQRDLYDIDCGPADADSDQSRPWSFTLDVKDYASAWALARHLQEKPIAANRLVLPRYRRDQLHELRRLFGESVVTTEDLVVREIRRTAARSRGTR